MSDTIEEENQIIRRKDIELGEKNDKIRRNERELREKSETIRRKDIQMSERDKKIEELKETIGRKEIDLGEKNQMIKQMSDRMEEIERIESQLNEKNQEIKRIESQLNDHNQMIQEMSETMEENDKRIKELTRTNDDNNSELSRMKNYVKQMREYNQRIKDDLTNAIVMHNNHHMNNLLILNNNIANQNNPEIKNVIKYIKLNSTLYFYEFESETIDINMKNKSNKRICGIDLYENDISNNTSDGRSEVEYYMNDKEYYKILTSSYDMSSGRIKNIKSKEKIIYINELYAFYFNSFDKLKLKEYKNVYIFGLYSDFCEIMIVENDNNKVHYNLDVIEEFSENKIIENIIEKYNINNPSKYSNLKILTKHINDTEEDINKYINIIKEFIHKIRDTINKNYNTTNEDKVIFFTRELLIEENINGGYCGCDIACSVNLSRGALMYGEYLL